MPNPYKIRGYAALFNAQRAEINDSMRQAGASPQLLQRFANHLTERKADIISRFKEEIKRDPDYAQALAAYTVGSKAWNEEVIRIAKTVPVSVKYQANQIAVNMGRGFPVFVVG